MFLFNEGMWEGSPQDFFNHDIFLPRLSSTSTFNYDIFLAWLFNHDTKTQTLNNDQNALLHIAKGITIQSSKSMPLPKKADHPGVKPQEEEEEKVPSSKNQVMSKNL